MKMFSKSKILMAKSRDSIGRKLCPTTPVCIKIPVHVSTNALAVTVRGAAFSPQPILWKETHKPHSGKNAEKLNAPPPWLVKCDFSCAPLQFCASEDQGRF